MAVVIHSNIHNVWECLATVYRALWTLTIDFITANQWPPATTVLRKFFEYQNDLCAWHTVELFLPTIVLEDHISTHLLLLLLMAVFRSPSTSLCPRACGDGTSTHVSTSALVVRS